MPLVIQGYSDDIVNVSGCNTDDEIVARVLYALITVGGPGGGVVVLMKYGKRGLWSATVTQIEADDDGHPIPWPISITHATRDNGDPGNSVIVTIDCPHDTPVSWRGKRRN